MQFQRIACFQQEWKLNHLLLLYLTLKLQTLVQPMAACPGFNFPSDLNQHLKCFHGVIHGDFSKLQPFCFRAHEALWEQRFCNCLIFLSTDVMQSCVWWWCERPSFESHERERERENSEKKASLNEKQLSVTANHARKTSNMKSNYIEVKLPQHSNFAATLVHCSQTPRYVTMWLLFGSSTRRQGRAPLCLNPPNEEMHYDVISFGSCRKAAVDNRAVWVAWFICVVTCDLCFRES